MNINNDLPSGMNIYYTLAIGSMVALGGFGLILAGAFGHNLTLLQYGIGVDGSVLCGGIFLTNHVVVSKAHQAYLLMQEKKKTREGLDTTQELKKEISVKLLDPDVMNRTAIARVTENTYHYIPNPAEFRVVVADRILKGHVQYNFDSDKGIGL